MAQFDGDLQHLADILEARRALIAVLEDSDGGNKEMGFGIGIHGLQVVRVESGG